MDQKDSHISLAQGFIENTLSTSDKSAFTEWLKDDEHAHWYNNYTKIYKASANYGQEESFDVSAALKKFDNAILDESTPSEKAAKLVALSKWKNIAASLLILLVAGFGVLKFVQDNNAKVVEMAYLDAKDLTLEDGSTVTLNTNAEIAYNANSYLRNRKLNLKGEAFFNVEKFQEADFVVSTNHLEVKVLGTAFSVKDLDTENTASVTVKEGKVNVSFFNLSIDLVAGEKLLIDHAGKSYKKLKSVNLNELSWATKQLSFKDAPLKNVFTDITNFYQITIDYPESLNTCLYTSPLAFNDRPINEVLSVLQLTFDMKMEQIDDNHFRLTGGTCQ